MQDARQSPGAGIGAGLLAPALALLGLLAAATVGIVAWVAARRAMHPAPIAEATDLADYDFAPITEDVRFPSLDGTPLAAWFVPAARSGEGSGHGAPAPLRSNPHAARPAVVLLHGYGNSRAQLLPHAAYLRDAGYHVLLLDFRNRGQSGGNAVTVAAREQLDVRGAVTYLRTRPEVDAARVAVQGVSMGAAAALLAMAQDEGIAAAVVESAFTDLQATVRRSFEYFIRLPPFPFAPLAVWIIERKVGARARDVRPVDAVSRVGVRPIFIIDDAADEIVPVNSGRRLHAAASGAKEYWYVEGATHAAAYNLDPDTYARRVLEFYRRYLAP